MKDKEDFYRDENEQSRHEKFSPSGRYRLLVRNYGTKPGCWSYSRGTVYRVSDGAEVGDVKRNYCWYTLAWIEDHPNGHSYLICGEDYQGQTVIELDTGRRRDHLPKEAKEGIAFCWVSARFDKDSRILVVNGCIWAAPYEYRFYDFADPIEMGWPELKTDKFYADADRKRPSIEANGIIRCFETNGNELEDDDACPSCDGPDWDLGEHLIDGEVRLGWVCEVCKHQKAAVLVEHAVTTLKREGNKLLVIDEWVSDEEKERRIRREEGRKRHEAEIAAFKREDLLYLKYIELLKDRKLAPEKHESYGITHENWCPDFKKEERRWCRRIVQTKNIRKGTTVDLEWGTVSGPIKIIVYQNGDHSEDKFFDHSIEGMIAAFEYAKKAIR